MRKTEHEYNEDFYDSTQFKDKEAKIVPQNICQPTFTADKSCRAPEDYYKESVAHSKIVDYVKK